MALAVAVTALVSVSVTGNPAQARTPPRYSGPYFGDGNFPPGCSRAFDNECHHMITGLNALDSPQVDVLILVPASPAAERELRLARQSVEMWEAGIDHLAREMGLDWLVDGMDFHITVDHVDPTGPGGEFTTYPIVDPEIVVVVGNPVPHAVGVDPVWAAASVRPVSNHVSEDDVPCHGVRNPFDFEHWESLPGFDRHHDERAGTYVEDCGGAGGNVCFAVNGVLDPLPDRAEPLAHAMFDVISHEIGHCLTIGHVGDKKNTANTINSWKTPAYGDIMSYTRLPSARTKCVSTLDVEGIAVRMSRYLDTNGDGVVDARDRLEVNDTVGRERESMQVQHPRDHFYASSTGQPDDCPQPDDGVIPGPRTKWTPTSATEPRLEVASPQDGTVSDDGRFDVTGTVEHRSPVEAPTATSAFHDDADDDGVSPLTEILDVDVEATDTDLRAVLRLAAMPEVVEQVEFMVTVNGVSKAGSSVDSVNFAFNTAGALLEPVFPVTDPIYRLGPIFSDRPPFDSTGGTWTWDRDARTVSVAIKRDVLRSQNRSVEAPYSVVAQANVSGHPSAWMMVDRAPDTGAIAVAAPRPACENQPGGCPDGDGDSVRDIDDACPTTAGNGADGCVVVATEHVRVYADGVLAGSQDVDTSRGPDSFSVPVDLAEGTHELRLEWEDRRRVVATRTLTVTHDTDDDDDGVPNGEDACPGSDDRADKDDDGVPDGCDGDLDGDGVDNTADNCLDRANADQADMDGDAKGDACDGDLDGDGHPNGKERAHGTDPADPRSHPGRG